MSSLIFSFEEMGLHDLNSTISYILDATGFEKLSVIAPSVAASQILIGMTYNLQFYQNTVEAVVLLVPIAGMGHTRGYLMNALKDNDMYFDIMEDFGFSEVFPRNTLASMFFSVICSTVPLL